MPRHPRVESWHLRHPEAPPDRPSIDDPDVEDLLASIGRASRSKDVGGYTSLNVLVEPDGLVVRVHRPFVSRRRILAQQAVRAELAGRGLRVPEPCDRNGVGVLRCGWGWAEIEDAVEHRSLPPTADTYTWLFEGLGGLHRALAKLTVTVVPRPVTPMYVGPRTLRAWLEATLRTGRSVSEPAGTVSHLRCLIGRLSRQWIRRDLLPTQLIHADVHTGNICLGDGGDTVYLDFSSMQDAPRVFDLAYALAYYLYLYCDYDVEALESFEWEDVRRWVSAYETAANRRLGTMERAALIPYTALVPMYYTVTHGIDKPFLELSDWLLSDPEIVEAIWNGAP